MSKLVKINPENPQERNLHAVAETLKNGGVIIYPTDTVYGLGCDIMNQKAIQRICQLKGVKVEKAELSFICSDLSNLSKYAAQIDNNIFKLMKRTLPGPYTFILKASSLVPKILNRKKKTVGIRVPDYKIPRMLVELLGNPIVTTSLKQPDDIQEYSTDPELIFERFGNQVDAVIDGGYGGLEPSTILDATSLHGVELIRKGKGEFEEL